MIKREETFHFTPEYPLDRLGEPERLLFFDIETTGLSADKNQVYMIGVLYLSGDEWKLTQWLSDTMNSEGELLDAFFGCLSNFKVLISFNGDTFDIPFLLRRCRVWNRSYDFEAVRSVDIYRLARPYKNILGLENCKQKSIESFLGIDREDIYSGGELINVYIQYLYTKNEDLAEPLLLHNADDLRGLPKILSILSYPDFFGSPLHLLGRELSEGESEGKTFLTLRCESEVNLPVPIDLSFDPVRCEISKNHVFLHIEMMSGTLKHYFPNPEDYYYLIYEDMAVHKSVGQYVSRDARRQASARTCYVKQEGLFLPQFDEIWEPVMKADRNDRICYALIDNVDLDDPDKWGRFSRRLLEWLGGRSSGNKT